MSDFFAKARAEDQNKKKVFVESRPSFRQKLSKDQKINKGFSPEIRPEFTSMHTELQLHEC